RGIACDAGLEVVAAFAAATVLTRQRTKTPLRTKRNGGPKAAVSFAESISLSSTVLVDLRLPPTALGLGFVLLALRARRARVSRGPRVPAQGVPETKMSQFGGSASRTRLQAVSPRRVLHSV